MLKLNKMEDSEKLECEDKQSRGEDLEDFTHTRVLNAEEQDYDSMEERKSFREPAGTPELARKCAQLGGK